MLRAWSFHGLVSFLLFNLASCCLSSIPRTHTCSYTGSHLHVHGSTAGLPRWKTRLNSRLLPKVATPFSGRVLTQISYSMYYHASSSCVRVEVLAVRTCTRNFRGTIPYRVAQLFLVFLIMSFRIRVMETQILVALGINCQQNKYE
jgi:hypothetical protein